MEYVALLHSSQESKIYVSRCQLNEQLVPPTALRKEGSHAEHPIETTIEHISRKKKIIVSHGILVKKTHTYTKATSYLLIGDCHIMLTWAGSL